MEPNIKSTEEEAERMLNEYSVPEDAKPGENPSSYRLRKKGEEFQKKLKENDAEDQKK